MAARLTISDPRYPTAVLQRLGASAPLELAVLGNLELLALSKIAVFCSARCPGSAILGTYDHAALWRNQGRCVVSGFHSPIEKECLKLLLRGTPPIIICPARGLPRRIPAEWRKPLTDGQLLILSAFPDTATRVTSELARRRNEFVAALSDEAWFAYVTPGGKHAQLTRSLTDWRVPFSVLAVGVVETRPYQ